MGSCERNAFAANGRISSSTTAKITTSEATMIGTMGQARIAPPVAIAADTPQNEIPDASGAAHSRLKLNHLRAKKYTTAQSIRYASTSAARPRKGTDLA